MPRHRVLAIRFSTTDYSQMADFDPVAMVKRFADRAAAVKRRPIPPVGPDRGRFIEQAQLDFQDYAMIGDAEVTLDDGVIVLRIDLRPKA